MYLSHRTTQLWLTFKSGMNGDRTESVTHTTTHVQSTFVFHQINIVPVYHNEDPDLTALLENAMFSSPEKFSSNMILKYFPDGCWIGLGLVKYPMECAVLMSGFTGSVSTFLTKRLMDHGVSKERFLFCEYF